MKKMVYSHPSFIRSYWFCILVIKLAAVVVRLSKCQGHYFHLGCIVHCYTSGYLQCPICGVVYGIRVGNMPEGTMSVDTHPRVLLLHVVLFVL